ncbi:MAG: YebC/PmpR family DNA-binding transcriptional regulator, partial [Planctomycetes bacterium]|nr:YebC/PmpR family DNA-binding transcriptional regulator [Planctomycetota bacterium]
MSGHSHWAGIKHKKAVVDNRRGRLFSKLARDIMVAARNGADPGMNLTLRYAIDKARAASMPRDNIERAVKKGSGEGDDAVQFTPCTYEGYGPGSVAILVDCLTDNRTRTAPGIKSIFEKRGGNMGAPGCVRHLFERKSLFLVPAGSVAEETLMEAALEAGAADVQSRADGDFEV